jgi:hypothetical protein
MSKQIIIAVATEGTTDIRFLESIIQRTFEKIAFECSDLIEVFDPIFLEKVPGSSVLHHVNIRFLSCNLPQRHREAQRKMRGDRRLSSFGAIDCQVFELEPQRHRETQREGREAIARCRVLGRSNFIIFILYFFNWQKFSRFFDILNS